MSAAARLPRLWIRIPPWAWMSVVSVVCCQIEVYASGLTLVQKSPTACGVSDCDHEASIMRRLRPTGEGGRGGCCVLVKKKVGWFHLYSSPVYCIPVLL